MQKPSTVIAAIEERAGFAAYKAHKADLPSDLAAELKTRPKAGSVCRIRLQGFKGMWEPGLVCGYMNAGGALKALVVYTERPRDELFDYELLDAKMVTKAKPEKPKRQVLNRKFI